MFSLEKEVISFYVLDLNQTYESNNFRMYTKTCSNYFFPGQVRFNGGKYKRKTPLKGNSISIFYQPINITNVQQLELNNNNNTAISAN